MTSLGTAPLPRAQRLLSATQTRSPSEACSAPDAGAPVIKSSDYPSQFIQRRHLLVVVLGTCVGACGPPARGTIGAILLRRSSGRVFIRDVPPHLAAYRAGVRSGDELLLIEGQDVRRLTDADLSRVLSGKVGEPVRLTLARGERILRLEVQRSMAEPYRVN